MAALIPKKSHPVVSALKKIAPLAVSGGILYYYFHHEDWTALWEACLRADLAVAVLAILLPQLVMWYCGALLTQKTLEWFHGPFSLRDYLWARGAMFILLFISPALGGSGMFLYQWRKAKISLRKLVGIGLFRFGMVMWGMSFVMVPLTAGLYYFDLADKVRVNLAVWWFFLLVPGVLFCLGSYDFWFYGRDPFFVGKLIVRDRKDEFWAAFDQATPRQWFLTWLMMAPSFFFTLAGMWLLSWAFEVKIPFFEFMVVGPVAMMVMDLPVFAAGYGGATLAWVTFFGDYGSREDIMALTFFFPTVRALVRATIGVVSLRWAMQEIGVLLRPAKVEPEGGAAAVIEPEEG